MSLIVAFGSILNPMTSQPLRLGEAPNPQFPPTQKTASRSVAEIPDGCLLAFLSGTHILNPFSTSINIKTPHLKNLCYLSCLEQRRKVTKSLKDSVFPKRENPEAIGERLNHQLRLPRQHAFGDTPLAVA